MRRYRPRTRKKLLLLTEEEWERLRGEAVQIGVCDSHLMRFKLLGWDWIQERPKGMPCSRCVIRGRERAARLAARQRARQGRQERS